VSLGEYVVCVGLATLDTILAVPGPPPPDGRIVASELVVAGGGPAATAAVALARLGVPVFFAGVVGDDDAGRALREGLETEGVDVTALEVVEGARSPQSAILVDRIAGTRSIVHYPGTVPALSLRGRARELAAGAAWVHADHVGYPAVRGGGLRLSIDGGNPILDLDLAEVELYAPTERALAEQFGSPAAALEAGARLVVVTRGAEGSSAVAADRPPVEASGVPVAAAGTVGAGDVFHGALLAWLMRGAELVDALRAANTAAALSCHALDGRSAIPTAEELERSLATGT
jgi:sugar/nucleoside kinase (ribokinase family)